MHTLPHYLESWHLGHAQLIAGTPTAQVFRVRREEGLAVLKIFSSLGMRDEGSGSPALVYFGGKGAARIYRHDEQAQLLEYLPGPSLASQMGCPVDRESAALGDEAAAGIIADVYASLHAEREMGPPRGLRDLTEWFRSLFCMGAYASAGPYAPLLQRCASVARELLAGGGSETGAARVLHGDLHHENIFRSDRGWLAIDPKGLWGGPEFDLAHSFFNPLRSTLLLRDAGRPARLASLYGKRLGLDGARILSWAYAYGGLSAAWTMEEGGDARPTLAVTEIIGSLI